MGLDSIEHMFVRQRFAGSGPEKNASVSRLKRMWRAIIYVRRGRRDLFWDVVHGKR